MDAVGERDAYGRRRLTERERTALLDLPLVGIWSTLTGRGTIHAVPVHYARSGSDIFILTERGSEKCRNALKSGRATFCVETILDGTDRRFVMVEGRVASRVVGASDLRVLRDRYGGWDGSVEEFEASVILTLTADRSVAWSDAD